MIKVQSSQKKSSTSTLPPYWTKSKMVSETSQVFPLLQHICSKLAAGGAGAGRARHCRCLSL